MPFWKYVFVIFHGSFASIYNAIDVEQLEYEKKILVIINNADGWGEIFKKCRFNEVIHLNVGNTDWVIPLIKTLKNYNPQDIIVITPFTYDNEGKFAKTTTALSRAKIYSIAFSKSYLSRNIKEGISRAEKTWLKNEF